MSLPTPVQALLQRPPNEVPIGLVGASNARHKYGNIILRDLVQKGYPVLPINPTGTTVEGRPAVTSPLELEAPVSILNFVVPPAVALKIVEALPAGRFSVLWFQPGAFDAQVVAAAEAKAEVVIAGPCIMVET